MVLYKSRCIKCTIYWERPLQKGWHRQTHVEENGYVVLPSNPSKTAPWGGLHLGQYALSALRSVHTQIKLLSCEIRQSVRIEACLSVNLKELVRRRRKCILILGAIAGTVLGENLKWPGQGIWRQLLLQLADRGYALHFIVLNAYEIKTIKTRFLFQ